MKFYDEYTEVQRAKKQAEIYGVTLEAYLIFKVWEKLEELNEKVNDKLR